MVISKTAGQGLGLTSRIYYVWPQGRECPLHLLYFDIFIFKMIEVEQMSVFLMFLDSQNPCFLLWAFYCWTLIYKARNREAPQVMASLILSPCLGCLPFLIPVALAEAHPWILAHMKQSEYHWIR